MADTMTLRVEGAAEIAEKLRQAGRVTEPVGRLVKRIGLRIEADAATHAPVDTGRLRGSIQSKMTGPLTAVVAPTVAYALFVEAGSKPHWPPPGVMQPWARRHGFPPGPAGDFLARRGIAMHGTRAQPFMKPAWEGAQGFIGEEVTETAREIEELLK